MNKSAWDAVVEDFADLLDPGRLMHVFVRLVIAALLGGILGYQREKLGKAAGLRTHMLVAVGAAMFVLVPQLEGMPTIELSRVIQGVAAGIGFVGGGAILKMADRQTIKGLTTAAGIWLTAAVGIAVGMGRLGSAILAAVLAFIIMESLARFDRYIIEGERKNQA